MENSVCLLVTLAKGHKKELFSELQASEIIDNGTGFFIDPNGLIATAKHVLKCGNDEAIFTIVGDKILPVEIIKRYELLGDGDYNDYALCKVALSSLQYLKLGSSKILKEREKLRVLGFSKHSKSKLSREMKYKDGVIHFNEIEGLLFNHGLPKIDGLGPFDNGFIMLYVETISRQPAGMSGGPVVNEDGEVVGLLVRGFNSNGVLCLHAMKLSQ